MTEVEALERWAHERVDLATAAPVFADSVPAGTALPAAILQVIGGQDLRTQQAHRGGSEIMLQAKAVDRSESKAAAHTLFAALDASLHGANGSAHGFSFVAWRERTFSTSEVLDGVRMTQVGGIYRVVVRPNPQ